VTVRVSEIYTSMQGEGPRTGMPTIFLRFGGCNLRCPGWPCDTLFAVLPEHRNEWEKRKPIDVASEVIDYCKRHNVANVCLTGGEPFLQPSSDLHQIVNALLGEDINVEAFSNGQIDYPAWAFEKVQFIMDWKLEGSGNAASRSKDTLIQMLRNIRRLKPTDAIKFVIKDDKDFYEAVGHWSAYEPITEAQWWAGVVWGSPDMSEAQLSDMILEEGLPWNMNVQTHKYVWDAEKRGV
jgi:7-carboxy-7-deazaguanine synthase